MHWNSAHYELISTFLVFHYTARYTTLHASCRAVYCNRSCLFVGGSVGVFVGLLPDNSKLRASILTKLGL